jgi:predicted RNA binding protein YcfA (HicA-like mRNA interferase family)
LSPRKSYKFIELIKKLKKYDSRFEIFESRGKGSHRMIYHPDIAGRPVSFPIICHGLGDEIPKRIVNNLIRAFDLPKNTL